MPIEPNETEARQASKEGVVRYVLGIGLALVIVGMLVVLFSFT
jgi:hypothetical protein